MPAKYFVNQFCFCLFFLFLNRANAQLCATPGSDGPTNTSSVVNTYFPPSLNTRLTGSSRTVDLQAVPLPDAYGTSYGNTPISAGDLLLFIQMQDGNIDNQNLNLYGSGIANSGPDRLGGTGYSNIGNAGIYEYAVALNDVSVSGGTLSFRGAGAGGSLVNIYTNQLGDGISRGKKTF